MGWYHSRHKDTATHAARQILAPIGPNGNRYLSIINTFSPSNRPLGRAAPMPQGAVYHLTRRSKAPHKGLFSQRAPPSHHTRPRARAATHQPITKSTSAIYRLLYIARMHTRTSRYVLKPVNRCVKGL